MWKNISSFSPLRFYIERSFTSRNHRWVVPVTPSHARSTSTRRTMTYDDPVLVARHGNEYSTLPNFEEITRLAHTKHQLEACFSLIDTCFFFGWQMPSLVTGRHGSPAVEKKTHICIM